MKAVVVETPGGPDVLRIREWPKPKPDAGWVLVRVKAFGLNRSELFTRQGHSGDAVTFPRVLGIECVGVVERAPDGDLQPGTQVAAVMGGLGRDFDGGYAEYTVVPRTQVMPFESSLPWATLAAIPETFLTAWGSLREALDVQGDRVLLVRGGTSSVGMAATTIAKDLGLSVIATTRSRQKVERLRANGVDHVLIDDGQIASAVRAIAPAGVAYVLELVGTATLLDSLEAAAASGIVCMTGILGNAWVIDQFAPMDAIPPGVKLTTYKSDTVTAARASEAFQSAVRGVESGRYHANLDRVFALDEIQEAHRYMEDNRATGKLVVALDGSAAGRLHGVSES